MRAEALVLLAAVAVLLEACAGVTQAPMVQPGTVTSRAMSGEEAHEYRVSVQAGQALRVRVTQIGVDVVLGVAEPDGQLIVEMDSPTGALGEEAVSVVAAAAGDYVIRVRPYRVAAGRYQMHVEPLRASTAEDRQRATVYRTLFTARRLIDSGDPRQVTDGIAQLQQVMAGARASGDTDLAGASFTQLLITNARAAFDGLSLPSVEGSVTVYFSPGQDERARTLQGQLTRAVNYFSDRLGVQRTVVLAVLTRDDWPPLPNTPYGMPFSHAAESLVVMPATHAMFDEFTVGIRAQHSASEDVARAVRSTGVSLEDGVRLAGDAAMYHELGHILVPAYGIGQPNLWFGEFVATYMSHAYQADAAPDPRVPVFADLLRDWLASASQPTYTSLDDLERHYLSMDLVNYAWYQAQFETRAIEIYKTEGLAFLSRLKAALPLPEERALSASDLLARLERIGPGFVAWGESLAGRAR
jgi:hypothetical protein